MQDADAIQRMKSKFAALGPLLDERLRRQWAAAEATAYGWGGIRAVSKATGLSPNTIDAYRRDLERFSRSLPAGARHDPARIGEQEVFRFLVQDRQEGRDPAFVALNEAWRKEFYALLLDVDRTLTPAQRTRAVAHFRRYAEDFAALSGRAGSVQ